LVWRRTDWIVPANQGLKKELELAKREMLIGHRYVQSHMTGCMIMKFYATDKVRCPSRIGFKNKINIGPGKVCGCGPVCCRVIAVFSFYFSGFLMPETVPSRFKLAPNQVSRNPNTRIYVCSWLD
jgi:hypothetical protein